MQGVTGCLSCCPQRNALLTMMNKDRHHFATRFFVPRLTFRIGLIEITGRDAQSNKITTHLRRDPKCGEQASMIILVPGHHVSPPSTGTLCPPCNNILSALPMADGSPRPLATCSAIKSAAALCG